MLQAFVITLREGLEAFLIIAISLAYLRKSGRRELIPAVHWGIGLSVLLSVGAAYLFQQASNQALWEGILALVAAVSVATLTVHMWRTAKKIKSEIEGHLRESTEKTGTAAWVGVFLFTLLMISREGMETALLMGTLLTQVQAMSILGGRHWRHARGGRRRDAVVALRTPRQPRVVLPGHGDLPDGVCRDLEEQREVDSVPVPRTASSRRQQPRARPPVGLSIACTCVGGLPVDGAVSMPSREIISSMNGKRRPRRRCRSSPSTRASGLQSRP